MPVPPSLLKELSNYNPPCRHNTDPITVDCSAVFITGSLDRLDLSGVQQQLGVSFSPDYPLDLRLGGNSITALGPSFVFNNTGVTVMDVSGNAIGSVDGAAFASVPKLESLDSRDNTELRALPNGVFSGLSGLAELLMDAPLECTTVAAGSLCRPSHTPSKANYTGETHAETQCAHLLAADVLRIVCCASCCCLYCCFALESNSMVTRFIYLVYCIYDIPPQCDFLLFLCLQLMRDRSRAAWRARAPPRPWAAASCCRRRRRPGRAAPAALI